MRRNLTADSHYTTPARLAPALPPIPGSEASAPPTPTPSFRNFVPPRSPPQSLGAAVERIARSPSQSPGNKAGSKKSSESGYASAPESPPRPKLRIEAPDKDKDGVPTAPIPAPSPSTPTKGPTVAGKEIGRPVLNLGTCYATLLGNVTLRNKMGLDIFQTQRTSSVLSGLGSRARLSSSMLHPCPVLDDVVPRRSVLGTSLVITRLSFLASELLFL